MSVITDSMGITGPSVTPGIIGNPSPTSSGTLQLVESRFGIFGDSILAATKSVWGTLTGGAPQATAIAIESLGASAKDIGKAVSGVATSASSGIRIGFILVVVVGAIILLAQLRRAVG